MNINEINGLLNISYGGNTVLQYIYAFGLFIVLISTIKICKNIIIQKIQKIPEKKKGDFTNLLYKILQDTPKLFYWAIYLFFPLKTININSIFVKYLEFGFIFILIVEIINIINKIIIHFLGKTILKEDAGNQEVTTFNLFKIATNIILWIIGLLFFLTNIGVQIGPLLASLGVGGIVLAFALQNILQDIFSSFTIYLDKPFSIGDNIALGTDRGTVKKIGLRSTRVITTGGQELVVSNRELTTVRVQNYGKTQKEKRRIEVNFGVTYETPLEKLKEIENIIKKIFENIPEAEFDRAYFVQLGNYSLDFRVYYYIDSNNFNDHLDSLDKLNFAMIEQFAIHKINFAYPTQLLYLNK